MPGSASARVRVLLCGDQRELDPGALYASWDGESALTASLIVLACDAPDVRRSRELVLHRACFTDLATAIRTDLAQAFNAELVAPELEAIDVSAEMRHDYLTRYTRARDRVARTHYSHTEAVKPYRATTTALARYKETFVEHVASYAELKDDLEAAIDAGKANPKLLAEARGLRDEHVRRCIADTQFSSEFCWNGTLARPLTDAIARLALIAGDPTNAYLELATLQRGPEIATPALRLSRALQSAGVEAKGFVPPEPSSPHPLAGRADELSGSLTLVAGRVVASTPAAKATRVTIEVAAGKSFECHGTLTEHWRQKLCAAPAPAAPATLNVTVPSMEAEAVLPDSGIVVVKDGGVTAHVLVGRQQAASDSPPNWWRIAPVRAAAPGLP